MEISKVSKVGSLTIPQQLRDLYGIREGSFVIFEEHPDGILVRPAVVTPVERVKEAPTEEA